MVSTIFERCGGFATVRQVVSTFYEKVLDSEHLQKYFETVDMRRLIDHQTKFVASVMGGPAAFSDDALYRVHVNMGISRSEFGEITMLLRESLEDYDLEEGDIEYVIKEVRKREPMIVTRDA